MNNQSNFTKTNLIERFSLDKVLAIIVVYNEILDFSETLNSLDKSNLKNEKIDVFVYDNSPKKQNFKLSKFNNYDIQYFHDPLNSGISKAYNKGAEIARQMGKSWLLFLDQDTNFGIDFIEKTKLAINQFPRVNLFAPILKLSSKKILSPYNFRLFYGTHLKTISPGLKDLSTCQPINSGIIIKLDSFEETGGYNEKVKLDFSDHQFLEKFKQMENKFVIINSIGIQNFSADETNFMKILSRFKYYCDGALNFETKSAFNYFCLHFFLILKMLKQTIKHRDLQFFKIYVDIVLIKKHKNK
jgi:hypothetical protein